MGFKAEWYNNLKKSKQCHRELSNKHTAPTCKSKRKARTIYQNLQVRTIQEALNPNSKQLSKIKLDNGENAAKLILIEVITDVVMFLT